MTARSGTLEIWTIDDGRAGIASQTRGLAEHIAALVPARISAHTVARRVFTLAAARHPGEAMHAPWPDLCIGCGRASIPYMRAMRSWSGGQTMTVQLQDPRCNPALFDLVIPPEHDGLNGDNVFPIAGAPVRSLETRLAAARDAFAGRMEAFPRPRLAVMLGGNSQHHRFSPNAYNRLLKALKGLEENQVSLLVTTSRRTPKRVRRALRAHFKDKPYAWLWTGAPKDGENPYFAFLQAADAVLVSNDSTSMLTDAASAGRPILLFPLDGGHDKFERFYDSLAQRGLLRPFTGSLTTWPVQPLDETRRAAEEVLRRLYWRWQNGNSKDAGNG